jgi:ABC-type dipeptide/oligopeptide/nickel transport system permease component
MRRLFITRLPQGFAVILGAVIIGFLLANVLGNPLDGLTQIDPATRKAIAHERGFDQPVLTRFADYLGGLAVGDFGFSYQQTTRSALGIVAEALPYTAILVGASMLLAGLVAIPVGVLAILRRGSLSDRVLRPSLILLQGIPEFLLGLILVAIFSIGLHWLPSIGVDDGVSSYVLPVLALSIPLMSTLTRLTRAELRQVLDPEFVTALRGKGLTYREIVLHHGVRNAIPPVVTFLALQLGWLVSGTILVEAVFGIPGIGSLALNATNHRDLPVLAALIIITAIAYVLLNLLADIIVAGIDPRVRGGATR